MCGVCGIVDSNINNSVQESVLQKMCRQLEHRGPDDEGIYTHTQTLPHAGLGHRRLKIIDLSEAAHQPMSNEDSTVWCVFNGEIYNYQELRPGLEQKHIFKSNSDTEIIIHLYEEYGENCWQYLRGMFAIAIWDGKQKVLFLARDRVGKKPLLYYYRGGRFCFASEFSAILSSGLIEKEINYEAVGYYLTFGYIPAPLTIYRDVFKLLPAHTLMLKNNDLSIKSYWKLDYMNKIKISEEDAQAEILRQLKEAVKIRLHSDVPLGAFLSGGIDSSVVVALMAELSAKKVKTFSIGFEEKGFSELEYARQVARRFNTDHNEFIVKPKAMEILPLLVERYGEPYADSSCIPTYYVAQQTKKYVTVALNGDGGDESFAGYERYQAMIFSEIYQNMHPAVKKLVYQAASVLPDSVNPKNRLRTIKRFFEGAVLPHNQRYLRWVSIFSEQLKKEICTEDFLAHPGANNSLGWFQQFYSAAPEEVNLLDRLLMTDVCTYLPNDLLVKMDIAGMANSLEARSPFLDHKVMEFTAQLPAGYKLKRHIKKYILKKTMRALLPRENIHRKKMGFGMPVGEWFRNDLKDFLNETILSEQSLQRGYFNPQVVRNMAGQHQSGKRDYTAQLWALLMLELWHQKFIN